MGNHFTKRIMRAYIASVIRCSVLVVAIASLLIILSPATMTGHFSFTATVAHAQESGEGGEGESDGGSGSNAGETGECGCDGTDTAGPGGGDVGIPTTPPGSILACTIDWHIYFWCAG